MSTSCSLRQYNRLSTGSLSMQMSKADLLTLIDKVADNLPGWKASLMNRAGKLVMVQAVLTAIPIYLMIALDLTWIIFDKGY